MNATAREPGPTARGAEGSLTLGPGPSTGPRPGDALVIVDLQRDFLPGGSLAVAEGDRVVPVIDGCVRLFEARGLPVYATRDWHPANHCSFAARGGPWPPHCVARSAGAQFAPGLRLPADAAVVSKATLADRDAYSGFDGTDLEARLKAAGIARIFVAGLATDYCVLATVLDAREAGFEVAVMRDAIAAVDAHPGDGERALERMIEAGAVMVDGARLAAG